MIRAILFAAAIGIGAAVSVAACSDDATDAPPETSPDAASAPETSTLDAAPAGDGGAPDVVLPYDGAPAPVVCAVTPCVTRVVAGPSVYCAMIDDGTLRCWGDSTLLGRGDAGADASPAPVAVKGLAGVVDVSATASQVCAVVGDGGIECWDPDRPTPAPLARVPAVKRLSLGTETTCGVTTSDQLDCWGDSEVFGADAGPIGIGGASATAVQVTDQVAFVLDANGVLASWGQSGVRLGRATSSFIDDTPSPVLDLPAVRTFSSSSMHACATTLDGRLFCWGAAGDALLGLGYSRDERYPVQVSFEPGDWPFQVSANDSHSCVRLTNGRVACWGGTNTWGELGFETQTAIYVPLKVGALPVDIVSVAVGLSSSCALSKEGAVYCWGDNREGQLGQGMRDDLRHPTPAQVVFP